MPLPALQQAVVGLASSSAAPATIAPAYGSATTAGTCLVAVVSISGSGGPPTATPPANWIAGASTSDTTNLIQVFYYPNNPGGFTTITFTLAHDNGACALLYEVSGIEGVGPFDINVAGSTVSSATVTSPSARPGSANEFAICALCWTVGQTLNSTVQTPPTFWTAETQLASSVGASNSVLQVYRCFPGTYAGPLQIVGTLSGASKAGSLLASVVPTGSTLGVLNVVAVNGTFGIMASGNGFPGSIGGA